MTVYDNDTVTILSIYRHYFFYINQGSCIYLWRISTTISA
ncbi:hypothetical protein BSCG_04212 [Bacteroides sp. 2_2_4]|uniref:Uncharacterized protein n=1 Tax=Bacteroides ovatus (strain ATCC 8483 / DSM 1896 / JCM 5824 / BCRC 10623 / CCUG 4943 / NCTC 11153) TaxID=411476 RepID=A0AAN3AAZ6_BACO1|nr:hypothetical protein BACOVA_01117 [Bacteroides ovatus ATCC 8483]EEO57284.1 hypothetical protein BSCG_04212 [Bacteroides sp. 2_2_4]